MKLAKRLLSGILVFCFLFESFPVSAFARKAAEPAAEPASEAVLLGDLIATEGGEYGEDGEDEEDDPLANWDGSFLVVNDLEFYDPYVTPYSDQDTARADVYVYYGETPLTYQWFRSTTPAYEGTPATGIGAQTESFSAPYPTEEEGTLYYYCEVYYTDTETGEATTWRSRIDALRYTKAENFSIVLAPFSLWAGDLSTVYEHEDGALFSLYANSAPGSMAAQGDEAVYSAYISPEVHWFFGHDSLDYQWYWSEGPDYTTGRLIGSGEVTGLNTFENDYYGNNYYSSEYNIADFRAMNQYANIHVELPTDVAGTFTLTLVATNHYQGDECVQIRSREITITESAEDLYEIDDYGYIQAYKGCSDEIVIPASIHGQSVLGIDEIAPGGDGYYSPDFTCVRKITFPEGMETIGDNAFMRMISLEEVVFPSTLTSIGYHSFYRTRLSDVVFPASLTSVGNESFRESDVTSVTFHDDTFPSIESYAFYNCPKLETVTFPANASGELCGSGIFDACPNLAQVFNWDSVENGDPSDNFYGTPVMSHLGSGSLSDGRFYYDPNEANTGWNITGFIKRPADLVIPGSFNGLPVKGIQGGVFEGADWLETLTISEGVFWIGDSAFKDCPSLTSVTLPSTLADINEYAFQNCKKLESVNFGDAALTYVGTSAFENDFLLASPVVLAPGGVVKEKAFMSCYSIQSASLDNARLETYSFDNCFNLETVTGSWSRTFRPAENGEYVPYSNFAYSKAYPVSYLHSAYQKSGDDYILSETKFWDGYVRKVVCYRVGDLAYELVPGYYNEPARWDADYWLDPFAEDISVPGSVTLQTVEGNTVTFNPKVASGLFNYMLTEKWNVSFGNGIKEIDAYGYGRLAEVTLPTTLQKFNSAFFRSDQSGAHLPGLKNSPYLKSVALPASVRSITQNSFKNCKALESLTMADGIRCTELPYAMCQGCSALRTIVIPEGVTTIGSYAFSGTNLQNVSLPVSLKSIGTYAFEGIPAEEIAFPALLETISSSAFSGAKLKRLDLRGCTKLQTLPTRAFISCNRLESIKLPDALTSIGEEAFQKNNDYVANITPIRELVFGQGLVTIGDRAFDEAFAMRTGQEPTVIELPDSVQTIGKNAFSSDRDYYDDDVPVISNVKLKDGHLPASLTSIGEYAFQNSAIDKVVLPENMTVVGDRAFAETGCLTDVVFNDGLVTIGWGAFRESALSPDGGILTFPESLKTIDALAFFNVIKTGSIQSVIIPAGIESIGSYAFGLVLWDQPMPELTVTILSSDGAKPELPTEGLADDDDLDLTVRCYENSATHLWAQDQQESNPDHFHFRLINDDAMIRLFMRKPGGTMVGTGELESICWYDEADESGRVLSRTTTLEDYEAGHVYRADIRTSDELRFNYKVPETLSLAIDTAHMTDRNITYDLTEREEVIYRGQIDRSAYSGQHLVLSFRTGDYVQEFVYDQSQYDNTLDVAEDGSFSVTTRKAPGELTLSAPHCRSTYLNDLQMRAPTGSEDGVDVIDLGQIEPLYNVLRRGYYLNYIDANTNAMLFPVMKGNFTLLNRTTGEEITDFYCGAILELGEDCYASVSAGDELELGFEPTDYSSYILPAPVTITAELDGGETPRVDVPVLAPGVLSVSSGYGVSFAVFGEDGSIAFTAGGYNTYLRYYHSLLPGTYTILGWNSRDLTEIDSPSWFEDHGMSGEYYIRDTVSIAHGDYIEKEYEPPKSLELADAEELGVKLSVDNTHVSPDYTPIYLTIPHMEGAGDHIPRTFELEQSGVISYFSAYDGGYAWLSDGTQLETSLTGGGGHTRPVLTIHTTVNGGTVCVYAKAEGQTIRLKYSSVSVTMPKASFSLSAPNSTTGSESGVLELFALCSEETRALVFVDGELQSVQEIGKALVKRSFAIPYSFESDGSASIHTVQVAVVDGGWQGETEEDWLDLVLGDEDDYRDTVKFLSDEYSVFYLPEPVPEPITLQITANNGEDGTFDGVAPIETVTVDYQNAETRKLPFAINYWNLNKDGTMIYDFTFDYVLTMSHPEYIKPGSVELWVYCGENQPEETVRVVPLQSGEAAGEYVGTLVLEGGTTTANDMPYAVAVNCDVIAPQFDQSLFTEASLEKDIRELEEYWNALAETIEAQDELYDVGVDMDEFEQLLQLFSLGTVEDEETGEERPVTEEDLQGLRDVAVEMNALSYEYNRSKQLISGALESLVSLIDDGSVVTSDAGDLTEEELIAHGAVQIPWEGGTLYYLNDGERIGVADLTHGRTCMISSQNGAKYMSASGLKSMLASGDPVGYIMQTAEPGSATLMEDDVGDVLGDIAQLNSTRSKIVTVADTVNAVADIGLADYNAYMAAYEANNAALETMAAQEAERLRKIASLEKKIRLFEGFYNEKKLEGLIIAQMTEGGWSFERDNCRKNIEQIKKWKNTLADLKAEKTVVQLNTAALRPPVMTPMIRVGLALKKISAGLQLCVVSGTGVAAVLNSAGTLIKNAKGMIQPLLKSRAGKAALLTLGIAGLLAAVGLEAIAIYEDYEDMMNHREATMNRWAQATGHRLAFGYARDGKLDYYLREDVMAEHFPDAPDNYMRIAMQTDAARRAYDEFQEINTDLNNWRVQRFASNVTASATTIVGIAATLTSGGAATVPALIATIPGNYWSVTAQIAYAIKEDALEEAYDEEFEQVDRPVGKGPREEREPKPGDPRYPKRGTPVDPKIDPAGYAYEAVASNRIEGVTATVWYLGTDGAEHEWTNAEEYAEVNPQITGEDGCYSWFTPVGKWKVKLEKDGYLPSDSANDAAAVDGWLPVPPPQLAVHIPMIDPTAPTVESVTFTPEGIVVRFSKYMLDGETESGSVLSAGNYTLSGSAGTISGFTVEPVDQGETPENAGAVRTYTRAVRILPAEGTVFSGTLTLTVSGAAESYAGTAIGGDVTESGTVDTTFARGDLNEDTLVDDQDATYLLFHTFFPEDYPVNQDCDFDRSGEVDDQDATYLLFHAFFPDEYPLD